MDEQKLLKRRAKASRDNNESALVSVCTDLANLYMEQGRYDFAIDEFKVVADIHKKHNKKMEFAVVNRGIGEAYLGLRKFEDALHYQKIYLAIAIELDNSLETQRAFATIGHIYLTHYFDGPEPDLKHLDSAYKFFTKSLDICESLSGEIGNLEIADMKARLFSNLGLVQDSMGNYENAIKLINKSIKLCEKHDLYEQLHRGYMSLGSTLEKNDDSRQAIQQYNKAVEVAKKLRNTTPALLAAALLSQSEVLIKLKDLGAAKNALLKAYKLQIPNQKERETIETNLKVVASMCKNQAKLMTTDNTDYTTLKNLYEKIGDGCCELKCYKEAIEYYKKMLDAAINGEMPETVLATCYYSLAETFKDDGQYDEAIDHFEKEITYCPALKDNLNSLSKIADTKEIANHPVAEIQTVYARAIELCQKHGDRHEEGRMRKRFIAYLRRQHKHSEAFKQEQALEKLGYESSDSDAESSEVAAGSVVGGDINLEDITDVSDDSDTQQPATAKRRRRTKNSIIKRNAKGESQLHTACIRGKLEVIRNLLNMGHPVNVRDNCGWLPLHEACSWGHKAVVEMLLERGAAINDRGGEMCGGVTPMHDAATNGHLEIVELLLDRGANPVVKNDTGSTVLHCLQDWRADKTLDPERQSLYDCLVERLSQALDKAGCSSNDHPIVETPALSVDNNTEEFMKRRPSADDRRSREERRRSASIEPMRKSRSKEDLRRSTTVGLEEDGTSDDSNIAEDYRNVMNSLRHKNKPVTNPKKTVAKRSALIAADEIVDDDWLEDDIRKSYKKRKTGSPVKSKHSRYSNDNVQIIDNGPADIHMLVDSESDSNDCEPCTSKIQSPIRSFPKKRTYQTKLTNFGHTRNFVEADSTSSPSSSGKKSFNSTKSSSKHDSFDNSSASVLQPAIDPTLSVDVKINDKLYRVPVLLSQVNTHTIKWLADEAASRYAKKEYMVPTLELETKNGAILADGDPISLLFPMGATQSEQVEARIVKWDIPPLFDRYREACQDMSIETNGILRQILQEFSVTLDLSNKGLKGTSLAPLCKVLNRQSNLLELHLAGNFLTTECVQFLGTSLASLRNLYKLNLSCSGLVAEHLQLLANNLSPDVSYKVTDLDLSDNQIGNEGFESLSQLTRRFHLKKLNLSGNKFTKDLFTHSLNSNCTLLLDQLEEFDVSDNGLGNDAIIKILSWLQATNLKAMNVSRNAISHGFLRHLLAEWGEHNDMKWQTLKLSRCCVQDSDLFDLLRMSNSLDTLDLSYNNELTSISLRRLLQCLPLVTLDLYGCSNIFKYFDELSKYLDHPSEEPKGKTIKFSLDSEKNDKEKEYLVKMWEEIYGEKAVFEQSSRFLCLSVSK